MNSKSELKLAWWILGISAFLYALLLGTFGRIGYENFQQSAYDFGIHAQAAWKFAFSDNQFNTLRGLNYWGDHLWFIMIPLSWLTRWSDSPVCLFFIQSSFLAASAILVFQISRALTKEIRFSLVLALCWLLQPALINMNLENFHPESLATFFLLAAILFWLHERWSFFAAALVFCCLCKEDVTLTVIAFLWMIAIKKKSKSMAAWSLVPALWFAFSLFWILPQMNQIGFFRMENGYWFYNFKQQFFYPTFYANILFNKQVVTYILFLFGPLLFLSFFSPLYLLPFLPSFLINLLSQTDYLRSTDYHYNNQTLPFVFLAAVMTYQKISNPKWRQVLMAGMAIATLAFHQIGVRNSIWKIFINDVTQVFSVRPLEKRDSFAYLKKTYVLPSSSISASHNLTPNLAYRENVYTFPNPFHRDNYGVGMEVILKRDEPDLILIDRGAGTKDIGAIPADYERIFQDRWFELYKRPIGKP